MHLAIWELKYSDLALWTTLVTCIFASLYISLWTVSFKDSQCLSALHLILLVTCSSAQISWYQSEYLCWRTTVEDNGEWLSSIKCRQWNCSAEGLPTKSSSDLISRENCCLSVNLKLRLYLCTVVGSGTVKSRMKRTARWSDVSLLVTVLDNKMLSSGRYTKYYQLQFNHVQNARNRCKVTEFTNQNCKHFKGVDINH